MELYEHLNKNLEELTAVFKTRMDSHERELREATATSKKPDLITITREFYEFKEFVTTTLSLIKSQIDLLLLGLDRHETAARRKVLLVHGIKESADESVSSTISHEIVI